MRRRSDTRDSVKRLRTCPGEILPAGGNGNRSLTNRPQGQQSADGMRHRVPRPDRPKGRFDRGRRVGYVWPMQNGPHEQARLAMIDIAGYAIQAILVASVVWFGLDTWYRR